jgi:hypothetical protein
MATRKFLLIATIFVLLSPLTNCLGEELFDKVAITKIGFFQKGKLTEVVKDDAPVRVRAYLEVKEIMAEFRDKFLLIFYLDDLPVNTFPISDIRYTSFVDYLWEKPTSGLHSIGASLSTATGAGERVSYRIFIEEVKPILRINSLEIDTTRRLKAGDKVKFFLFVSNGSEKVILPNDFTARLELKSKKEERNRFFDFRGIPIISPKAHNVSLGPIEWVVEDGDWLVYPQILPGIVNNREAIEVVKPEDLFLDLRIGESRPDLFVKLSLSPPSPYMGKKVQILVDLENKGNIPCEKYGLSLYVDGRRKGSIIEGPAILPGETKNFQFDWTAESGTHYLKVSAPYRFDEREFLTKAELPLTVETGMNLVPIIISWKPTDPQSGDIMTILTRIKNMGVNPITPWDEAKGAGYKAIFSVDGIQKEVKFDNEIAPGEKGDFEFTWEAEEGKHLLKFSSLYIEAEGIEPLLWSDEKSIEASPRPKLVCVSDNWTPNPPTVGDIVMVSLVVKNDGKGGARLWDRDEMVGYKIIFSIGPEKKEDSKPIPPEKEVTFSFQWKVEKQGEYPVNVLFIDPSGKEIAKPYTGTLAVLSSEPVDELGRETLKFLEKKEKNKVSLYKSLGKNLEELLHPSPSKFEKLAKKTSKIALATLKCNFEEGPSVPFSDESRKEKDLMEVSKTIEEIVENINKMEGESVSRGGEKLDYEYGNLRNYIARSLFSEGGIVSLLENEAASYRQMEDNNLAVREGRIRPYPDAKNELLRVLKAEEKLGMEIYGDFHKEESIFTFLRREGERGKRAKIQLGFLRTMIGLLRSEGVRAGNLQKGFYNR